jgi:leucine dehydrogenase
MGSGVVASLQISELEIPDYERVIEVYDETRKFHAIVAIHNTTMGPSLGGLRIFPYPSREAALADVLRLAKGMTYKSAIAESGFGGGKSVVIADPNCDKTEDLLRAYADVLNLLDGRYICGKDLGSTLEDLAFIHRHSRHVAGFFGPHSSGDPSPFTAWGTLRGMESAAQWLWGSDSLKGRRVAIQGLGGVGMRLVDYLYWKGAKTVVYDIDERRVAEARRKYGSGSCTEEEILSAKVDILAPCAGGGILSENSIDQLRCQAVVGCANSQLANDGCGWQLHERGILYAPDFVVNAGGLLNAAAEFEPEGYCSAVPRAKVYAIYNTLLAIYQMSEDEGRSTAEVAVELALKKLETKEGARRYPVYYH